jgi:hypothetical protein
MDIVMVQAKQDKTRHPIIGLENAHAFVELVRQQMMVQQQQNAMNSSTNDEEQAVVSAETAVV